MRTYNSTSDYESGNNSYETRFEDIEVTDINGDGQTEITGFVNIDGTEAIMVDIDRDGVFDIGFADYDGDGEYDMDQMEDITDLNYEVEDFVCEVAIDNPLETIEFGGEGVLLDIFDDSQIDINHDVCMSDFMSNDAQIDELESMLYELDQVSSELDDIIADCDSAMY